MGSSEKFGVVTQDSQYSTRMKQNQPMGKKPVLLLVWLSRDWMSPTVVSGVQHLGGTSPQHPTLHGTGTSWES